MANWLTNLPLVLLGLRNAISKDTDQSAAQAVYGRQLNVPGCIFENIFDVSDAKIPKRDFQRKDVFLPNSLQTCDYVWLRKPGLQSSLSRPYSGPYKVLDRNMDNHTIKINYKGNHETVTMERIKPAWGIDEINAKEVQISLTKTKTVSFENENMCS